MIQLWLIWLWLCLLPIQQKTKCFKKKKSRHVDEEKREF